ncbi:MAG: hypothetical protein IJP31_00465 [Lachnospiraceae bacterium]|nr:hypothetical protein [Lachnospiraceae bacterium]
MTDEKLEQILRQALAPKIDDSEIKIDRKVRRKKMKKEKKNTYRSFPTAAAIILAVLLIGGGSVYAAREYFGLLDFSSDTRVMIPEEAETLIEKDIDQVIEENSENTIINCSVREALCDREMIMIVYEVSAKEQGKYLFIPEDASADSDMSQWSNISGITAGEYAKQKGLSIMNIGGGITNRDELGIIESTMNFKSVTDDVMSVYVRCGKESNAKSLNVECVATVRALEAASVNDVLRKEMQFTLEDISQAVTSTYISKVEGADNPGYEIIDAKIIQTELGTYVDVHFVCENSRTEGMSFKFKSKDGRAIETIGGSGIIYNEDGSCSERYIMNKIDFKDGFIIEIYDYHTNETYETVNMTLK